jgi:hypothetical protein
MYDSEQMILIIVRLRQMSVHSKLQCSVTEIQMFYFPELSENFFVGYFSTLLVSHYMAPNGRITDVLVGSGRGLTERLSRNLTGGTDNNQQKSHFTGIPVWIQTAHLPHTNLKRYHYIN